MSLPEVTATTFSTEVLAQPGLTLVDFYGTRCPACVAMLPVLGEVAEERGDRIKIVKADTGALPELAARFRIHHIPNLVLFRNGEPIGQRIGRIRKADLLAWIDES
jgi:thioredoxin 1